MLHGPNVDFCKNFLKWLLSASFFKDLKEMSSWWVENLHRESQQRNGTLQRKSNGIVTTEQ